MERFEVLYRQLFKSICEYCAKVGKEEAFVTQFPVAGKQYTIPEITSQNADKVRFMLVGRCTNGWGSQKQVPFLAPYEEKYVQLAKEYITDRSIASKWREDAQSAGYNINKSSFWRTARDIWAELAHPGEAAEADWYEHIIWTNLFPVGPKKEGNASNMLCDAQTDTAIDLFREIIRYFQPTHVLVESGMNWFSFTYKGQHHSFLDCIDLSSSNYCVVGWCVFPETKSHIIIANRPEGKKDEEYCNDIIQTFNAMTDAGVVK